MNNRKLPFRLVFTNKTAFLNLTSLNDLLEWRHYQSLKDYDFLVLKLGHNNTLHSVNFDSLFKEFKNAKFLLKTPIMFSLFSDIPQSSSVDLLHRIDLLQDFTLKMKSINPEFKSSIAWNFDFMKNEVSDLNYLPLKPECLNYNLYLHHYNNLDKALSLLSYIHLFNGFDITSYNNNFELPLFDNRSLLFPFFDKLKEINLPFLEQLSPEYLSHFDTDNNFKSHIKQFCEEGFIIDNDKISPLIYGSFDDFSLNGALSISQILLMTLEDVIKYYTKLWTKDILVSHCSSCDYFNHCQNKMYYWSNLQSDNCSLNLDKHFESLTLNTN